MKKLFIQFSLLLISIGAHAQDEESSSASPLVISGSVDLYYKYDFADVANIGTSFGSDHNSFSLGMINVIASKEVGKASFVADLGFGPRNANSTGPSVNEFQPAIQNLYVSYALSDKLSVTAGYMGTFVGYEIISPTGNFNYSTSYLFTNGPFQNAGLKFQYSFSDKVSLMAGVFNDWNVYEQATKVNSLGAQLYVSPVDGWDVYINGISGENNGMELDLTSGFQVSEAFYIGLNAATWSYDPATPNDDTDDAKFSGAALYTQFTVKDGFALGLRSELFSSENTGYIGFDNPTFVEAKSLSAFTLSANIGSGALNFIPELRFDNASENVFINGDGDPTKSAFQFLAAAVFSF